MAGYITHHTHPLFVVVVVAMKLYFGFSGNNLVLLVAHASLEKPHYNHVMG